MKLLLESITIISVWLYITDCNVSFKLIQTDQANYYIVMDFQLMRPLLRSWV